MIKLKRVYEPLEPSDGTRFLVERLWPRGMKMDALHLDSCLKYVAPSQDLRRWFGHNLARRDGFRELTLPSSTPILRRPPGLRDAVGSAGTAAVSSNASTISDTGTDPNDRSRSWKARNENVGVWLNCKPDQLAVRNEQCRPKEEHQDSDHGRIFRTAKMR